MASVFNFFPLSDLKYNLPQILGKIRFFRGKYRIFLIFRLKINDFSRFFPDFFSSDFFFVKIVSMPPENQFFAEKLAEKSDFLFIETTPDLPVWKLSVDGAANAQGSGAGLILTSLEGIDI